MSGYLIHYASEYYDPVKAHEYYEAHKKLKGRHSTAGLNEKGREAAAYVKEQLRTKKKNQIADSKTQMETRIASRKESMQKTIDTERETMTKTFENYKANTQRSIDRLSEQLKGLSAADRKGSAGENLRAKITKLRANNQQQRKLLQNAYSTAATKERSYNKMDAESYKTEHKSNTAKYKQEYDDNYASELEKLRNDKSMVSKRKSK